MVNNYDRIFGEITKVANRVAAENDLDPEPLIELVMEIVNIEDQNRIKRIGAVDKKVEGMITDTATSLMRD